MKTREIDQIVSGSTQYDGAGVKLVRVVGYANVQAFDPFLMMDAFDSTDSNDYIKGFPWHPHRGIETVTYLIHGDIEHGDSLGNRGNILDGCCQWMTAGSGIIHQEMPQPAPRMLGVQLWLNLPQKEKMTAPKYRDIRAEQIPEVAKDGSRVRVISGSYAGQPGAIQGDYVPVRFLDVALAPGADWSLSTPPDETVYAYILEGGGRFGSTDELPLRNAVLFTAGDELTVKAAESGVRFLLFAGKPLHEPVAWGGPIVMNTREELNHAFAELEDGTFIKTRPTE